MSTIIVLPAVTAALPTALAAQLDQLQSYAVTALDHPSLAAAHAALEHAPAAAEVVLASPETPTLLVLAALLRWSSTPLLLQEQVEGQTIWRNAFNQACYPVASTATPKIEPQTEPVIAPAVPQASVATPAKQTSAEAAATPEIRTLDIVQSDAAQIETVEPEAESVSLITIEDDSPELVNPPTVLRTRHAGLTDGKLLFEVFRYSAYGEEMSANRAAVEELMLEVSQRERMTPQLLARAEKNRKLGHHAYMVEQGMLKRLHSLGNGDAFQAWYQQQQSVANPLVKRHLDIRLEKALQWQATKQQKANEAKRPVRLREPDFSQGHHPNSLRHLPAHQQWDILIDEAGQDFEHPDQLSMQDRSLGKLVALAIPVGAVKLPALKADFHAADEPAALVDQAIDAVLQHPVGVLGITIKDPLIERNPQWLSAVHRLIRLVMRLLPITPEQTAQVNILIEQRGNFDQNVNLYAVGQLLLTELRSLDQQRFEKLNLNLQFIQKSDHPANGYVDALAYTWGAADQRRLNLAKFKGHCFLRPSDVVLERLYAALDGQQPLQPADWYQLLGLIGQEPSSSILHYVLADLGQRTQQQVSLWLDYLDEVQQRIRRKQYHANTLATTLGWLQQYQPAQQQLPPLLKLQWIAAQLAAANHQGQFDLDLAQQALTLGQQLMDEAAPDVCQAYLRIAVAATNAFEFQSAQDLMQYWEGQPIAVAGRLKHAKVLSSLGQHSAFMQRYAEAQGYFDAALQQFEQLSDPKQRQLEAQQTRIYRLLNLIEQPTTTAEQLQIALEQHWQHPLDQMVDRLAVSDQDRFDQHLLLRALVCPATAQHPAWQTLLQRYLAHHAAWQVGQGHPWALIQAWRGWLLHQNGQSAGATVCLQDAVQQCFALDQGHVLNWIGLVYSSLAQVVGLDVQQLDAQQQVQLLADLPHAPHAALTQLQQATGRATEPMQALALLAHCLPFNFR